MLYSLRDHIDLVREGLKNHVEAMPNHERDRRPLLLGEGQELRGKIARDVAFERHRVRDPEAVEDGEQR